MMLMTSMIRRFWPISRRFPIVCRLDKRFVTGLPAVRRLMDQFTNNILDKNLDFLKIHGPTADQVTEELDLSGKTCLITGVTSGLGLEASRVLSARGCAVLAAGRNAYAASNCGNPHFLHFYETNLASLQSVKSTADEILKLNKKIDIVILNAGVFGLPWTLTDDGLETTFQVNYLSQYYLLMIIEKMLSPNVRVVFISSDSHRNIKWTLNNVLTPTINMLSLPKEEYTSIKAYNVSKLCGLLAMHYLGYRWLNSSKQVFCANPGSFVKTNLCRNWWVYEALYTCMKPFSKSISQGASTPLYCATSPALKGLSALYFKDCQRCEESELAKDLHLSFRIQDLTYDILRDRVRTIDEGEPTITDCRDQGKDHIGDNIVSNYSG